jgi:Arc/MetJ-type ribon-helix-helix transcriptional regulator
MPRHRRVTSRWYDKGMSAAKVAVTIPKHVLERAKIEVATGRAKNLSALVSEALEERLNRDELGAILEAMDAEYGPPSKSAKAWAKRVLGT